MRRIVEFKAYRSFVDYDIETGQFVSIPAGEYFPEQDEEAALAEILPFPAQEPVEPPNLRKAG